MSLFCAVGFVLSMVLTPFIDSQIDAPINYGLSAYQLPWLPPVLGISVLLFTLSLLYRWGTTRIGSHFAWIPTVTAACFAFLSLRPVTPYPIVFGFPILCSVVSYGHLRFAAIDPDRLIRTVRESDCEKITWTQETIAFYKNLFLGVGIALIALLVPWILLLWENAERFLGDVSPTRLFTFALVGIIQVAFLAIFVFVGPICSWISIAKRLIDSLLDLPTDPLV